MVILGRIVTCNLLHSIVIGGSRFHEEIVRFSIGGVVGIRIVEQILYTEKNLMSDANEKVHVTIRRCFE